jgi:hypothetical protein
MFVLVEGSIDETLVDKSTQGAPVALPLRNKYIESPFAELVYPKSSPA